MALTLTINGVDKTSLLKDGSLDVEKTGSTESLRLDVLIKDDNTASAYRPAVGDTVRLLHNADLLGGGPIVRVEDQRIVDDTGTVTVITVRDWLYLAEQILIEDRFFPSQGAFELFDQLVTEYLTDKGVTNISSAVTGGPDLPDLFVKGETLLSVFLQMTEQTGYPFRINADKQCALVEPGSLPGPVTLTTATILGGLTWTQDQLIQANRLSLTTGTPEAGAGPITFSETHIADGTLAVFPVNVIPNRSLVGRIDNAAGYAAAATSIAVKALTPGMEILQNNSFTLDEQASLYVVQSDVTVDEDGKATVSIAPGLDDAVADNDAVTFSDETGIQLAVNGTPTDVFGSDWVWDRFEQAVVNPVTPPSNGDEITITTRVTFPAVVRVWETASVAVQDSVGHFDFGVLVDGTIDGTTHTDLPTAAAYARDVLTRRLTPPKIVHCTTYEPGWYPYLSATLTWTARLLTGLFLVTTLRVRAVGIDPASTTHDLPYELELVEGDQTRQSWIDYYRGQNPAQGILWGATPETPATPGMQWTTNYEYTAPAGAAAIGIAPNVGVPWSFGSWVTVVASMATDSVLTAVHMVSPGSYEHAEIEIGVGAAASEVPIAAVRAVYAGGLGAVGTGEMRLPIPVDAIPSGARVAARMRSQYGGGFTWTVAISYLEKPIVGDLQVSSQPVLVAPAGAGPVSLAENATPWAFGAWATVITSASADLVLVAVAPVEAFNGVHYEIEIGIGAAASEVTLMTIRGYGAGVSDGPSWVPLPNPLTGITSGSRVAARWRKAGGASGTSGGIAIAYMEAPL